MPLKKGRSKKAVSSNVRKLRHEAQMTRRGFFGTLIGGIGAMFMLSRASVAADVKQGFHDRTPLLELCDAVNPPIEYSGQISDPNYYHAWKKRHADRKLRLYVDGVDRTGEAYECYVGEKGWVNVYVKERGSDGKLSSVRIGPDRQLIRAGFYGKVEWKKPLNVQLSEWVMKRPSGTGI